MIGGCTFDVAMAFLDEADRTLAQGIAMLAYCNPFLPERIEGERAALGPDFVAGGTLWDVKGEPEPTPNLEALERRAVALADRLAAGLRDGARPPAEGLRLYEGVVIYTVFTRY